jgi:hypothetical protein
MPASWRARCPPRALKTVVRNQSREVWTVPSAVTPSPRATASRAGFARARGLYRRTRHRTIGAEYAAIALLRPRPRPAAGTFKEGPAGRHGFRFGSGAVRAGYDGFQDYGVS